MPYDDKMWADYDEMMAKKDKPTLMKDEEENEENEN